MRPRSPLLLAVSWIFACGGLPAERTAPEEAARFVFEEAAMGTLFRIVVYARDASLAESACARAFTRIHELDARLSDYQATSELSRLARASDGDVPTPWVPVSADLFLVLARAQSFARLTDGAFDVTVGPYVRLWRRARRRSAAPSPERLEQAARSVGHEFLELDPDARAARLLRPDMRLDLGGIAKGYALDEALEVLVQCGLPRALVDGGGDVRVGEAPPGHAGWRVEIAGAGSLEACSIELVNAAVATSGDLERFVELEGVRYSHLVDPATGLGLRSRLLVTVVAQTGMHADAWASSLSVLDVEAGFGRLAEFSGVEARVVGLAEGDPTVSRTSGFPPALSSSAR